MSMPQCLVIAVISGEVNLKKDKYTFGGEKASAVAAILIGQNKEKGPTPYIFPVAFSKCRSNLTQFGMSKGFMISERPLYPRLLNPKEIDFWLALDKEGVQEAQKRIKQDGSSSNAFYRGVFQDAVMYCGFSVPNPPLKPEFQDWFNLLVEKFEPWKNRFWKAFEDSS